MSPRLLAVFVAGPSLPAVASVWNLFGLVPEGCGTDWDEQLSYSDEQLSYS